MYSQTVAFAILGLWLVSACLAEPVAKAEACGGCYDPCTVHRCHTFPIHSSVGIKTTHRIIPSNTCGYGGWGYGDGWGYGNGWGYGGGHGGGYGGWGGWGNGCGGYGGGYGGWGGWGNGCGCGWY